MTKANVEDPERRLERERNTLLERKETGEMDPELVDRLLDLADAINKDYPGKKYVKPDGERAEYTPQTVYQYLWILKRWHDLDGIDYLTATADDVNRLGTQMDTGRHPNGKDDGYARQTTNKFFCATKAFYGYHQDLGVDRADIEMFTKANNPAYDEQDMFTREEIEALRNVMTNPRDRALLEMFIYTGQRIRALLTLRIKDLEVENGYFYLNDTASGLKGADKRGRKRPLFGARKYVRDWLSYHPRTDNPDEYVFIGDPSNPQTKEGQAIGARSVRRLLKQAGEEAGVDDVKPHKFRHYFVSVMSNDYGIDDDTIKFLLGHNENSNVMNTTYKHITSEDYIQRAEEVVSGKKEETRNSFVPAVCAVCEESLQPDWKSCPACGEVYAPDAQASQQKFTESLFESAVEVSNPEQQQAVKILKRWISENPGQAAEVLSESMMSQSQQEDRQT